jgi:flagellar biosynthesis GTPase FlhF
MDAYRNLIAERTRDFTGRKWGFAEIERWLSDPEGTRFFILTGEPGVGKTSITARLVQIRTLAAHLYITSSKRTVEWIGFIHRIGGQTSA